MSETPEHPGGSSPHLTRDLTLYLLARFGLIALIAVILVLLQLPLLVSVAAGFLVGLPLGLVVLRPLNRRVTAGLAVRRERRNRERAELRAQLRGDSQPGEARQPDESRHTGGKAHGDKRGEDAP